VDNFDDSCGFLWHGLAPKQNVNEREEFSNFILAQLEKTNFFIFLLT